MTAPAGRPSGEAHLEALGQGRFRLSGTLDAHTVTAILKQSEAGFVDGPLLEIDLSGVSDSDSAGLALLIEWLRMARQRGTQIRYANMPAQLQALARISEVQGLLDSA